jgi:hypothetical protein
MTYKVKPRDTFPYLRVTTDVGSSWMDLVILILKMSKLLLP